LRVVVLLIASGAFAKNLLILLMLSEACVWLFNISLY